MDVRAMPLSEFLVIQVAHECPTNFSLSSTRFPFNLSLLTVNDKLKFVEHRLRGFHSTLSLLTVNDKLKFVGHRLRGFHSTLSLMSVNDKLKFVEHRIRDFHST